MKIPAFTAEACLYRSDSYYQVRAGEFTRQIAAVEAALIKGGLGLTCTGSCPAGQLLCECDNECKCCVEGCRCVNEYVYCNKTAPATSGVFAGLRSSSAANALR